MAVSHVKSNPVANMTGTVTVFNSAGVTTTAAATDLVRPLDWNSAHNQFMTIGGNTVGASTLSGTNIVFEGAGAVTLSGNADTLVFSAPVQTAFVLSNSNGLTFGTNVSTVTASHNGLTSQSNQAYSAGNGSAAFQTLTFADSNGVSFSTGTQGLYGTVRTNYAASDHSHGNPTLALTNLSGTTASASNGLTISLSAAAPGAGGGVGLSAGTQSVSTGTVAFANSNGITFGMSGSSQITASHNGLTTARASNDAIGLNTALTANGVSMTANSSGLSLNFPAFLTTAALSNHSHGNPTLALTNLSGTTASNSAGLTLSLSAAAPGGAASVTMYATGNTTQSSTGTQALSSMIVRGDGGVSAGISNGSIVVSGPALTSLSVTGALSASSNGSTISLGVGTVTVSATGNTTQASSGTVNLNALIFQGAGNISAGVSNGSIVLSATGAGGGDGGVGISAGANSLSAGTVVFSNSNGVTFGLNGSTVTASHNGLTTAAQSNHSHGNPTLALTNLSGTTASNSAGLTLSLSAAAGGGVNPVASASNGSFSFTTLNFSNANNVTFGTSAGSIITASVAAPGAAAEQNAMNLLGANTAGNTTATGSTIGMSGLNVTLSGTNASQIVISAPATSSLVATGLVSISTNGSTISIGVPAGTATLWQPFNEAANIAGQQGQAIMHFAPLPTPAPAALGEVHVDRLCVPLVLSNSSNSSGTVTLSYSFGLYTKNNSTLSLFASTSYTTAATFSGTVNNSTFAGVRLFTVPWTTTIPDGRYYVAHWSRTTTGGGNATFNQWLASQAASNYSGIFGDASNRSVQYPLGYGAYSVSFSTAMPGSVPFSALDGTASIVARPPSFFMISGTI